MTRRIEIILGPTGVGKTSYAIRRALECGSPVISCDSRQIYKELCIGTAVPSPEELAAVKHYFIRTVPITENYTAGIYEVQAIELVNKLFAEGHDTLVMCGGSMLYIDAFCFGLDDFPEVPLQLRQHLMECLRSEGVEVLAEQLKELDPVSYGEIDLSNGQRVIRALEVSMYTGEPFSSFKTRRFKERDFEIVKIGLERPREELYDRINARVLDMMDRGLEAEARSMLPYRDLPALQTVGYKEMFGYFDGEYDLDE
nr:tRNA (adenosine(37)-N6)-dimethylallyltransferase MiaA [Bacteroidales bacterium]